MAGEREAATSARERILRSNPALRADVNAEEFAMSMPGNWHKKLFLAICHKYEVKPYRYRRQKYTTVMVRVNEGFLDRVLWREFLEYSRLMDELINEITDDLISKVHAHADEDVIQGELP